LKEVRNVQVTSHDGTLLDGWIASPAVPAGVRTPTVLIASPYFDLVIDTYASRDPGAQRLPTCDLPANQFCDYFDDNATGAAKAVNFLGFRPIDLIREGYTLAFFSVRGTGSSGGCFEWGGQNEQRDQVALVNYLAKQPWSNGRIGMGGVSYLAYTSWQTAVQAPPALKTIVTGGDLTDLFEFFHSPQGALAPAVTAYRSDYEVVVGGGGGAISGRSKFLQHEGCPHAVIASQVASSLATGDRNAAYWQERNLSLRLPAVRAAVLHTDGYFDPGHAFQSDPIWGSLDRRTPRAQIAGWWAHEFPTPENSTKAQLNFPSGTVTWEPLVIRWLDYWLKGVGPAPRTGTIYHQDQDLRWHESSSWPPRPTGKQVLYLADNRLAPTPRTSSTSFRSAPLPTDASWTEQAVSHQFGVILEPENNGMESSLCAPASGEALGLAYLSPPVTSPTLIAGNPYAYLKLASDQPGGVVTATLFDVGPDFACTGTHYQGARWMSSGSADLSFYNSPFVSRPFPVDTPTNVRLDLRDLTYTIAPGHRLALTLSHGDAAEAAGTTEAPTIAVSGTSQLVVPVVEGTLGGKRPTLHYPRRPFTPSHYSD
jgi:putative CocE/NonD family hydrolase